jgi:cytochrome P450
MFALELVEAYLEGKFQIVFKPQKILRSSYYILFKSNYSKGLYVLHLDFVLYKDSKKCIVFHCRFLPTPRNRKISKLIHKNEKILKQVIQIRQEQARVDEFFCANDILDLMMSTNSNKKNKKATNGAISQLSIQNLVDECKTLFLAGYATTTSFLTWTMLLLAEYPEWQERARAEIQEVCSFKSDIDATKLNQMKIVSTYFYNLEMLCKLNNCYMFICVK